MMPAVDYQTIKESFKEELIKASDGKKTSLPFIIHQLASGSLVKEDEEFQVLKIGGSILQNALVCQKQGRVEVLKMEEEHLPIFSTGKSFLAFIKSHLRKQINVLAINFAYPLKPFFENNQLDGILMMGSKEHAFTGLIGKRVGLTLEEYILKIFGRRVRVSLANDTICLTLSGLDKTRGSQIAGGIVGTGMNFAFFLDENHLVNLESANFNKFLLGAEAKIIDLRSLSPNDALFEKEVSGAYLFQHYNLITKEKKIHSTHEMDKVARGELPGNKKLARDLFARSARLIACQIGGILEFKKQDMVFIMEGSLFWEGFNYRKTVEETVRKLTKFRVLFKEVENCGIIGAAKLVI